MRPNERVFRSPEAFLAAFPQWREGARPGRLGFTNGCFDLVHPGHVQYLEDVRDRCDFLVLGLNGDASVARLKGASRPVQDEWARARVLLGLRSIDAVVLFDEDTPLELITALKPDLLAKGGDYTPETVVGREVVEARGGELALIPFLPGHSTSGIVKRILDGRGVCAG
jgi:D-beta-D-heptose 7-phosphate kinase/D-beta-D-heptose 1-phosphate adenosyltransferase